MSSKKTAKLLQKCLRTLIVSERREKYTSIMFQPAKPKGLKEYNDKKNK